MDDDDDPPPWPTATTADRMRDHDGGAERPPNGAQDDDREGIGS